MVNLCVNYVFLKIGCKMGKLAQKANGSQKSRVDQKQ